MKARLVSVAAAVTFLTLQSISPSTASSFEFEFTPVVFPDTPVGSQSSLDVSFIISLSEFESFTGTAVFELPVDPHFTTSNPIACVGLVCSGTVYFSPTAAVFYESFLNTNATFLHNEPGGDPFEFRGLSHGVILMGTGIAASAVPAPAAFPLLLSGLGLLGLLGWRNKRKAAASPAI